MSITYLQNKEPLNAETLNRPLSQIESKLNELEGRLDLVTGNDAIVAADMRYDPSDPVVKGCLVYIGTDGMIHKALAVWDTTADVSGVVMPAASAYVEGLVVSVDTSAFTADVVLKGHVQPLDQTSLSNLLPSGVSLGTGAWCLSDTEPGKIMRASGGKPYLRIPVIRVDASGRISLTGVMPYSGYHMHKEFEIPATASWTESDDRWSHTGSELDDLTFFNWTDATVLIDGVYDYDGKISLDTDGNGVVVYATEDMTGHVVHIFTAVPDSHDEPVVRGIRLIGSGRVNASAQNGLVTLGIDGWSGEEPEPEYSDRAVSQLTENGGYKMTKVVSRLAGDGTVSVREGANGEWVITNAHGPYVRPATVSFENATVANSGGALYYVFPNNRASGVTGALNIPTPPSGWSWRAYPFIDAANSTVNLSATMSFCQEAAPGESRSITPSADTLQVSATATGSVVTGVSASYWTLAGGGSLWLRLYTSGNNASDMGVISFGVRLEATSNS